MTGANDIDIKIEELKNKQPTLENLNLLSDFYLKKGDKKKAIEYLYKAVAKISFAQKDKAIAIYKKILNISPLEINAHEGLIDLFSRAGLVEEEIKHLQLLALLYQNRGDFKEATPIFRRIYQLDPKNRAAELFFSRGKVDTEGIKPPEKNAEVSDRILMEDVTTIREEKSTISKRKTLIIFVASAIALATVVGLSLYFLGKVTENKGPVSSKGVASISTDRLWVKNTKTIRSDTFEIEVTRLTDELLYKMPIVSSLSQEELSENSFYFLRIKAIEGCIPEDFIRNTSRYISLTNAKDRLIKPKELTGLNSARKVIYKSNICQKESGIIFTHFYIVYTKRLSPAGLSIDGLEDYPLTVKWN